MKCNLGKLIAVAFSLALAVTFALPASAQVYTGRIDVTLEDATGGRLPGASVDLTGPVIQSQTTDSQGQAHFLNLSVGTYTVKATLPGFNPYNNTNVQVVSNTAVPLDVKMAVAGAVETVNVTAATPLIDIKKQTITTNVTLEELQSVPSARDPWVIMQSVPSVYMDRVNVGGSESGQQSNYNAKGAMQADNTWAIDGVPVTDMGATGSSSFYYNFDSFQEMAITTGGADAQNSTGGVQLNMILKKGANTPHGDASIYFSNDSTQDVNISPTLAAAVGNNNPKIPNSNKGNRTDLYRDAGFDLGGPVVKDRLWAWGQVAQTNIRLFSLAGAPDETIFKTRSFKLDGQASNDVRGNFTFYYNNKLKFGRGASPQHPAETTWDQSGLGGGTKYFKGEGNFVGGQRLFASIKVAHVKGGFQLIAEGGDRDFYQDENGVWHNSFYNYASDRPQDYVGGDGSYFAGKHEVKFGASWRSNPVTTGQTSPASRIWTLHDQVYPRVTAEAARDTQLASEAKYVSAFVTDTVLLDRLTLTGGLRFDRQTSGLAQSSIPGVTGIASLPAINSPAVPNAYRFNNVTPRVGATYALDAAHKTIARASYAMFASQLPGTQANFISPIQYAYAYYNAIDRNGDHIAQLSEILFNEGLQGYSGFDPTDPLRLTSVNKVDPNVKAPRTHEALVGVDRELMPNLAFSATFTWRRMNDMLWQPLIGVKSTDYVQTGTLSGTLPELGSYSVPLYALRASAVPPGGGQFSTNRAGYHQRFVGLEMQLTKRMSDRWMGRLGFSTNSWTEHLDDPSVAIIDPTKAPAPDVGSRPFAGPQIDRGQVVRSATGSGKSGIYMVAPRYQIIANGLYQAPWGFNFGASVGTQQGYAEPFFQTRVSTGDPLGRKTVLLAPNADAFRLPAVTSMGARVEWKGTLAGRYNVALDLDVFNVFNSDTILGKQFDARFSMTSPTGFGQVLEIMNPRVARLGVRFFF